MIIFLYDLIQVGENDCIGCTEVIFRNKVRTFFRNYNDRLAQDVFSSIPQMFDDAEIVPDMKKTGNVRDKVEPVEALVDGEGHRRVPQRLRVQHPGHLVADRDVTVVNQLHRAQEVPAIRVARFAERQRREQIPALLGQGGQDFGAVFRDQLRIPARTVRGRNWDPGIPAKLQQRLVILKSKKF